ncbi:MAG: beta-carotene 15,15'-monooxygenase [Bacteroidetes bacterium]|nr:beta-carotene 15,15'-monooxygenase [Bacteroidota bacterium]MBU1373134.1 beta-carotene 15,15'-monooxygenase [Bacteroidota bacterium]MBU1484316.1 beta-carotene 15,15'-monooxygenase [Bacteroidota bacterium]MBU1760327.1 beta-carotene 15,15'-monooxygenase [Bacteroidota bacterium]MBU2266817.1 beta-carotene 15,15'-monooxygenase [Bacteroidota bacterium]
MIQQFRNLNFINILLLLILLIILRIGIFMHLPNNVNSGFLELFSRLLIPLNIKDALSPTLNITLAGLIVFSQALLFNRIINNLNVLGKSSFIPALFYIICSSVFSPFLLLSPPLICNYFILFIIHKILQAYKESVSISTLFDLGLVVAIGTIFYFPFVLFLVLLWASLIILKPFNWREWIGALIGYLTIVFFLGVYYFWNGHLLDFYEIWKPLSNKFPFYIKINVMDYIVLFPIVIVMILGFLQIRQNFFRSYILIRKFLQLVFFVFVIAALSFYLKSDFRINHFLLCVIPISTLLSYYFITAKKKWAYESFFLIIVGFIIYFQFF